MQIEYPSLSDRVYEYLSKQIIEGNIKYGEKLNIKVISEQLNVSTMPVRDALKKLEMENIVRIKPRSNCIVAFPTKKSILDAAEMRELLELHAAKLIYQTITASELRPINEIVGNMEKLTKGSPTKDQTNRYIYLDLLFHTELCNLAGNEYLIKFYREVNLPFQEAVRDPSQALCGESGGEFAGKPQSVGSAPGTQQGSHRAGQAVSVPGVDNPEIYRLPEKGAAYVQ